MGIRDSNMAAEAQRFMDHPLAKVALNVIQTVAVAALLGVGSISVNKLDSILNSINEFKTDMALVKRDVLGLTSDQSVIKNDVDALKKTTYRLELKVEQLEKEQGGSRGRKEG